jgi:hypothetical protein
MTPNTLTLGSSITGIGYYDIPVKADISTYALDIHIKNLPTNITNMELITANGFIVDHIFDATARSFSGIAYKVISEAVAANTTLLTLRVYGGGGVCGLNITSYINGDVANTVCASAMAVPYDNDFSIQNNGWTTTAGSSWEWNTSIKPIATRMNKCYITRANVQGYNNNELSYVTSPVFNTANLPNLELSFKRAFNLGAGDKVWIEYSKDNGAWTKLGTNTTGRGWYTNNTNVWMGQSGLTQLKIGLPTSNKLQIRFVFQTDASGVNQGFMFDNVNIRANTTVVAASIVSREEETVSETNASIVLYPNPTTGRVLVEHPIEITQIEVYDIMGKQVISTPTKNTTQTPLDLTHLPNGIYVLYVEGLPTQKIIKQ